LGDRKDIWPVKSHPSSPKRFFFGKLLGHGLMWSDLWKKQIGLKTITKSNSNTSNSCRLAEISGILASEG